MHTVRTEEDKGHGEVRLGAGADVGAGNGWNELDWRGEGATGMNCGQWIERVMLLKR